MGINVWMKFTCEIFWILHLKNFLNTIMLPIWEYAFHLRCVLGARHVLKGDFVLRNIGFIKILFRK